MTRHLLLWATALSLCAGLASADPALAEGGRGRWAERVAERVAERGRAAEREGPPGQARRLEDGRGAPREAYAPRGRRLLEDPRDRYDEAPRGRGRFEEAPRGRYDEGPGRYGGRYDDAPRGFVARPGYAPRPGGFLPPDYRGAPVGDYQRYRLRPPPRGYSWIHVGNGFALVGPDGQVFDVIQ